MLENTTDDISLLSVAQNITNLRHLSVVQNISAQNLSLRISKRLFSLLPSIEIAVSNKALWTATIYARATAHLILAHPSRGRILSDAASKALAWLCALPYIPMEARELYCLLWGIVLSQGPTNITSTVKSPFERLAEYPDSPFFPTCLGLLAHSSSVILPCSYFLRHSFMTTTSAWRISGRYFSLLAIELQEHAYKAMDPADKVRRVWMAIHGYVLGLIPRILYPRLK